MLNNDKDMWLISKNLVSIATEAQLVGFDYYWSDNCKVLDHCQWMTSALIFYLTLCIVDVDRNLPLLEMLLWRRGDKFWQTG